MTPSIETLLPEELRSPMSEVGGISRRCAKPGLLWGDELSRALPLSNYGEPPLAKSR